MTTEVVATPSYHPFHYRPFRTLHVGMRHAADDWTVLEGVDLANDRTVPILQYQADLCPMYPQDRSRARPCRRLLSPLEATFLDDVENWIVNPRTKGHRQLYRMEHSGLPLALRCLLGTCVSHPSMGNACARGYSLEDDWGLLPDVEWPYVARDREEVEQGFHPPPHDVVPVHLMGCGPVLVLTGEPGAGKSHLAQLLARLVNGHTSPYVGEPAMTILETDACTG